MQENEIKIRWKACHLPYFNTLEDDDITDDEADDNRIVEIKDYEETTQFELKEKRSITLLIGLHDLAYFDVPLLYSRESESFDQEYNRFQKMAKGFDPFGRDSQAWITDGKSWIKTTVAKQKVTSKQWMFRLIGMLIMVIPIGFFEPPFLFIFIFIFTCNNLP